MTTKPQPLQLLWAAAFNAMQNANEFPNATWRAFARIHLNRYFTAVEKALLIPTTDAPEENTRRKEQ